MNKYQHSQTGYLMIFAMSFVVLIYLIVLTQAGLDFGLIAMMVLILLILASFTTLKVTIDEKNLRLKFGYGLFNKKFALSGIASAKAVKNHWYYGWGIKWWPWMWIYSVSGLDAVEIKMKNGKTCRIGTDEPEKLQAAIAKESGLMV